MSMQNIEAGVRRALQAYKVEAGMGSAEASAWADTNLAAGLAKFNAAVKASKGNRDRDAPEPEDAALDVLKGWAQS